MLFITIPFVAPKNQPHYNHQYCQTLTVLLIIDNIMADHNLQSCGGKFTK